MLELIISNLLFLLLFDIFFCIVEMGEELFALIFLKDYSLTSQEIPK
jgi:hypothetical protein